MSTQTATAIQPGQVLVGPLFSEPMRVVTVSTNGLNSWDLGLVGQQTAQFRRARLNEQQLATLSFTSAGPSYDGDGGLLRLGYRPIPWASPTNLTRTSPCQCRGLTRCPTSWRPSITTC